MCIQPTLQIPSGRESIASLSSFQHIRIQCHGDIGIPSRSTAVKARRRSPSRVIHESPVDGGVSAGAAASLYPRFYSISIVPGGFEVTSYTTRHTLWTTTSARMIV